MELPRGYIKPLAKILGPLCLWMAAGWAAYPFLIVEVSNAAGEAVNAPEVQLFSYIMAPTSVIAGIALIIYGYTGKEVDDPEINALNTERWPCPVCLTPQIADAKICENCGNIIIR